MIERGTILRGFFALFLIAIVGSIAYMTLSNTDGTSGNFLEDGDTRYTYGPIFEDADQYRRELLADKWVRQIPVHGGTFGDTVTKQIRIDMDGTGAIPEREVTLQTRPAVTLFNGPRRDRAEGVLHGIQRILEERNGLIRGISMTETEGGMESATIAAIVKARFIDRAQTKSDRALVTKLIQEQARGEARDTFAWYRGSYQEIVLGPVITKGLVTWIRTPKRATPAQNIFTAYVLRHELEHSVTPSGGDDYAAMQWLEEGGADVMARWPGAAAETARELGMPYPKRYEKVEYKTNRGGYPGWTNSIRILLGAAGVDWRDPKQLDEATALLQEHQMSEVPAVLAAEIAKQNRLGRKQRIRIEVGIRTLNGNEAAARRLVGKL